METHPQWPPSGGAGGAFDVPEPAPRLGKPGDEGPVFRDSAVVNAARKQRGLRARCSQHCPNRANAGACTQSAGCRLDRRQVLAPGPALRRDAGHASVIGEEAHLVAREPGERPSTTSRPPGAHLARSPRAAQPDLRLEWVGHEPFLVRTRADKLVVVSILVSLLVWLGRCDYQRTKRRL